MTIATRPPVPFEPSPGKTWVVDGASEALEWRVGSDRPCARRRCDRPGVAELNRGLHRDGKRISAWSPYCELHLYGRWSENGQIVHWRLVEIADA